MSVSYSLGGPEALSAFLLTGSERAHSSAAGNSSHNNSLKHSLVYDHIYRALFPSSSVLNEIFRHGKSSCPTYAEFLFKYVVKLQSATYKNFRKNTGNAILSRYLN